MARLELEASIVRRIAVISATVVVILTAIGVGIWMGQALLPVAVPATSATQPPATPTQRPTLTVGPLPGELRGKAWLGFNGSAFVAGELGGGSPLLLPDTEIALAAGLDRVVSVDAASRSTIFIRDLQSGNMLVSVNSGLIVDNGTIGGDSVFLAVRANGGTTDGGIVQLPLDGTRELRVVIPGSDSPLPDNNLPVRLAVVSRSGRTVGATICATAGCVTDIAQVDGGTVATIADGYLRWLSDDFAAINHHPALRLYSIVDGKMLWSIARDEFWGAYFLADQTTLIFSARGGTIDDYRHEIVRADVPSGTLDSIATFSGDQAFDYQLIAELSGDEYASLLTAPSLDLAASEGASVVLLTLETGDLAARLMDIGPTQ